MIKHHEMKQKIANCCADNNSYQFVVHFIQSKNQIIIESIPFTSGQETIMDNNVNTKKLIY